MFINEANWPGIVHNICHGILKRELVFLEMKVEVHYPLSISEFTWFSDEICTALTPLLCHLHTS